uniref:Zn-finger in Ran binding protein and others, putative n=1 Tax=Oryza sativa subsp. japonica TaxID=39947 RepID=Q53RK2_ORYSJ|nr:Zn-finger in Ran binding protein and others, putative [Oryza sativa Japonica Group]
MASSSKLLALTLTSSFLRSSLLPAPSRRLPTGPLLSLRFCSAAGDVADAPAAAAAPDHPWPEWGDFLEKLRAKGYFEQPTLASRADAAEGEVAATAAAAAAAAGEDPGASADNYPSKDLNRLKNACLKFGRERFDLLSVLPKQDIRAIVECGCPNIFRKPVNSAKRLREFLQIDEGDACSACKLRGSCDKAYVIPNAEDEARTVDVMRILLNYAIDPTSLSGENSVNGGVQESARKLLSELTMLSDTTIDPSIPKPVFQTSSKTKTFDKGIAKPKFSAGKGRETTETEMKKGDWLCPNCAALGQEATADDQAQGEPSSDDVNSTRKAHLLDDIRLWLTMVLEDYDIMVASFIVYFTVIIFIPHPQCHFMNFARNKMCFKCEESRPKRQLIPGEWECPSCSFVNFRRNKVCLKCKHEGPENDTHDSQHGHNRWRNTRGADRSRSFDDSFDREDDGSDPDEGERRRAKVRTRAASTLGRSTGKSKIFDSIHEDGNGREDDSEDVLPYEGQRRHIVSKRATPAQRRFTAGRSEDI